MISKDGIRLDNTGQGVLRALFPPPRNFKRFSRGRKCSLSEICEGKFSQPVKVKTIFLNQLSQRIVDSRPTSRTNHFEVLSIASDLLWAIFLRRSRRKNIHISEKKTAKKITKNRPARRYPLDHYYGQEAGRGVDL